MSEEGPKLYTKKPKKAKLKASSASAMSAAPSSGAAAASCKMGSESASAPNPPPPPQPKESFLKRYKFLIPLVLGVNFVFGAYLFMRTKKKDTGVDEEVTSNISSPSVSSTAAATPVSEKPIALPTVSEPLKICDPIPENQQRELFKWILEEKRKVKPKDPEEKKLLDEEKAILKQFIRTKSIPNI